MQNDQAARLAVAVTMVTYPGDGCLPIVLVRAGVVVSVELRGGGMFEVVPAVTALVAMNQFGGLTNLTPKRAADPSAD